MMEEQLLRLVSTQNDGIITQLWKKLSSKVEGTGKFISVAIDKQSRDKISETGSSIVFRFGKIPRPWTKEKTRGNKGWRGPLHPS